MITNINYSVFVPIRKRIESRKMKIFEIYSSVVDKWAMEWFNHHNDNYDYDAQ